MGHSRPRRIRSSPPTFLPRNRPPLRLLRHRLSQFLRKRHGQGNHFPLLSLHTSAEMHHQWYPEVLHFCPTTPLVLVGLKSDLRTKRACIDLLKTQGLTPVTPEQGQSVAKQMGATYVECSSKEMNGVHEIFDMAVDTAVGHEIAMKERKQVAQQGGGDSGRSSGGGFRKMKKRGPCNIL